MVQQLSALILRPEVDASKYTSGMAEKTAADKAGVASAREMHAAQQGLSVVLTDTSAKISTTGDVIARMSRQYVEGAKQTQMFGRDLNALNRALESGKAEVADVANILVGMNQKLGLSADASAIAATGQSRLASAVELANDRIRQQTTLLNEVSIAEARAAQAAENQRQAAAVSQGKFNQLLGVGSPSSTASASASAFQAEFDRLEQIASLRAQQIGGMFRDELNSSFGIGASGKSASASGSVFEQAARESEMYEQKARDLRAVLGDVSVMQDRLNAELAEYATLAERGLISSEQLAKAQQMARTQAARGVSGGASRAAGFSAGQQVQDVMMMSLLGQSPMTLALQQGPQLASAIQQGGGLAALGAGLASVFNWTTLLTVGFTAATAATIQWAMKGRDEAKSFNEALKAHSDALRLLKDDYGKLGEAAKTAGNVGGIAFTDATARSAQALIEAQLRTKAGPFLATMSGSDGGLAGLNSLSGDQRQFAAPVAALLEEVRKGNSQGGLEKFRDDVESLYSTLVGSSQAPIALRATADAVELLGQSAFEVSGKFAPFADQINRLKVEGAKGLASFNTDVEAIGRNKGIQSIADEAIIAGKEVVGLAEKLAELERITRRLKAGERGPLIGSSAEDDRNSYLDTQRLSLRSAQRAFDADMAAMGAKSPQELAAAARAREAARDVDGESADVLNQRIDLAGKRALLEAEHSLTEARDQRTRSITASLDQQRLELDLIGKTGGEQAKLRFEFERMQELREQAARTGEPIDQKEVANIQAAAEAMGQYADALARTKLGDDLSFERGQFFRSPLDQQIASRQRSAGLPIDMGSPEALQMRQIDKMERAYEKGMNFWDDFEHGILKGDDFGKSLGDAIRNAFIQELSDIGRQAFGNFLKAGLGALFPGVDTRSTGSIGGSVVGSLLGGANDNFSAPAGKVTRLPLPDIGAGSSFSVANATNFIKQYSSAIGIDPDIALKVARSEGLGAGIWQSNYVKGGFREPSFGPFQLLKGGKGTGFGTGLGNRFMAQTGLDPADPANWQQSTAFALDQAKANGWGAWFGAQKQGITGFAGIDRNVTNASQALDKLATSSVDTAKTLEGGLGMLGSALNQFPAAPSGGGGLLGSLLGGLNSAFSGSKAFNWLSANPGGYIGLFDSGGTVLNGNIVPFGPKTRSLGSGIFADSGFGPGHFPAILEETESVLTRDMMGRTMRALRGVANQNSGGGGPSVVVPDVRVYVDQDGNWQAKVESISQGPAKQESAKAVGSYAYQQRQGGAAQDDHRYQRLKRRG